MGGGDGDGCHAWSDASGADDGDAGGDEGDPGGWEAAGREPRLGWRWAARQGPMRGRRAGDGTCLSPWCRRCPLRCRCLSLQDCCWNSERDLETEGEEGAQEMMKRQQGGEERSQPFHGFKRIIVLTSSMLPVSWQLQQLSSAGPQQHPHSPGSHLPAPFLCPLSSGTPPKAPSRVAGPVTSPPNCCCSAASQIRSSSEAGVGTLGPAVARAPLHIPLRARADARVEAVRDGEGEGDGGGWGWEGGRARGRRVGVAERGRGRQRVVRAGAQTGVLWRVAGVRGARGVVARFGIRTRRREWRSVRFHLKLEEVKVIQVLHGQRAGGERGHGEGRRGHDVSRCCCCWWSFNRVFPYVRIVGKPTPLPRCSS